MQSNLSYVTTELTKGENFKQISDVRYFIHADESNNRVVNEINTPSSTTLNQNLLYWANIFASNMQDDDLNITVVCEMMDRKHEKAKTHYKHAINKFFSRVLYSLVRNSTVLLSGYVYQGMCSKNVWKAKRVSIDVLAVPGIYTYNLPVISKNIPAPNIPNRLDGLRFISCGKPPNKALSFAELFTSFDVPTWILGFTSVAVYAATLGKYLRKTNFCFVAIKLILEQGTPFTRNTIRTQHLAVPNVIFLLTFIILSNAYKNFNVSYTKH